MSGFERASLRLTRPETGVLTRKDKYLLCWGNVHARQFMFYIHTALVVCGIWAMLKSSNSINYDPPPIPGIDGHPLMWYPGTLEEKPIPIGDFPVVTIPTPPKLPYLDAARNALLLLGYIYLISGLIGYGAVYMVDKVYANDRFRCGLIVNPTVLLIPYVLSVASFSLPLSLWAMRVFQSLRIEIYGEIPVRKEIAPMENITPSLIAVLIVCSVYFYILYAVSVTIAYSWRRGADWYKVPRQKVRTQPTTPRRNSPKKNPTSTSGGRRFKMPIRSSGGYAVGRNLFPSPGTMLSAPPEDCEIQQESFESVPRVLDTVAEEQEQVDYPQSSSQEVHQVFVFTRSEVKESTEMFAGGTSV